MDWTGITTLVVTALGTGGIGGAIGKWYADQSKTKERDSKRQDDKYWKLVDKQGAMLEAQEARFRAVDENHGKLLNELAVAKAAVGMEKELRLALQKQFDELDARVHDERRDCDARISALEAEIKSLRGPMPPPPQWPQPKQQHEVEDHAGRNDEGNAA